MMDRYAGEYIHGQESGGRSLKRRGILAAAGAVVAGLVAKQTSQPVAAAVSFQFADTATRVTNNALGQTDLLATLTTNAVALNVDASPSASMFDAIGVLGEGSNVGVGVMGLMDGVTFPGPSHGAGVYGGSTPGNTGVLGQSSANGNGVVGACNGIAGLSGSYGVWGKSDIGVGVTGFGTSPGGTGVYGQSDSATAGNGNGVYGHVHHIGSTQVTAGVFGDSDASYGVIGRTTAAGYSGCTGIATTPNTAAFAGGAGGGAYAAYFTGPTVVQGDFTVVSGMKNAAVKHTDGSYRLLHCVESPEAWFEDFGEAKLVNGRADVKLDPDFAAVVNTGIYHVFLTPQSGLGALRLAVRRADGFAVEEIDATGSGIFSYRVVAKRKDVTVGRLAKFDLPKIRLPKPEEMPPPPPPSKRP